MAADAGNLPIQEGHQLLTHGPFFKQQIGPLIVAVKEADRRVCGLVGQQESTHLFAPGDPFRLCGLG